MGLRQRSWSSVILGVVRLNGQSHRIWIPLNDKTCHVSTWGQNAAAFGNGKGTNRTREQQIVNSDGQSVPYLCMRREQQNHADFVNGKGWINCIEFVLHEGTEKKAAFVIGNGMNKPYRNCKWGSNNRAAFVQKEEPAFVHGETKNDEQIIPDL